jgi:hypothetical protein
MLKGVNTFSLPLYQKEGQWLTKLCQTFSLENFPLWFTELYKKLSSFSKLLRLTISPQKGGKKLGVSNCAQLRINEKSTPGVHLTHCKLDYQVPGLWSKIMKPNFDSNLNQAAVCFA